MDNGHLAANLRTLCGNYRSVAEVCRRIGINRQQFNKYLSGATAPSLHTLKRICDFFGVDEAEIFLAPGEFHALTSLKRPGPQAVSPLAAAVERVAALHPDSQQKLRRYCGYYSSYFRSPAFPGMVFRTLYVMYQKGDHTYTKAIERMSDPRRPTAGVPVSKYLGTVLFAEDRIYLMEYSPIAHQTFALTVLYPSFRSHIHLLSGLCLAVSGGPGRQAGSMRMVFEYLGETVNLRDAIRRCGIYPEDSDEIGVDIRDRVRNAIGPDEQTLCALPY